MASLTRTDYIDDIKLTLSGGVLDLEIDDETIGKFVDKALMEMQRYIDETKLITIPFARCIDLTGWDEGVSAIVKVYRTQGYTGDTAEGYTTSEVDPMYAQFMTCFTNGGTGYSLQNYVMNYLSYSTLLQMRNTLSTDLAFRENKGGSTNVTSVDPDTGALVTKKVRKHELYISANYDNPATITIEYIPVFKDPSDITSDY